jgi:hypothetical protein
MSPCNRKIKRLEGEEKMLRLKKIGYSILMVCFLVAFGMLCAPKANALLIGITPDSLEGYFEDQFFNETALGDLLYKMNVDPDTDGNYEEGPYLSSYTTIFNPPDEPNDATITYDGAPAIGSDFDPLYLIVKDGAFGNYYFNLRNLYENITVNGSSAHGYTEQDPYSWDGMDTLALTGFWDGTQGAISHVSIRGDLSGNGSGGDVGVPEPTTMLLLGTGLVGVAAVVRKKTAR